MSVSGIAGRPLSPRPVAIAVAGVMVLGSLGVGACGPASTRSLIASRQLSDAIGVARDRPEETEMVVDGVVDALKPSLSAEVFPSDAMATLLGEDGALLADYSLVKIDVRLQKVDDLSVRTSWQWNGQDGMAPTLFALSALTGERRELSPGEKLSDLGRTALLGACVLSVGTVCPPDARRQTNASKVAPTPASAPRAAHMERALARPGFVLVAHKRDAERVRVTVEIVVHAMSCETPPCGELHLLANVDVAGPPAARLDERFAAYFGPRGERAIARDQIVVQR